MLLGLVTPERCKHGSTRWLERSGVQAGGWNLLPPSAEGAAASQMLRWAPGMFGIPSVERVRRSCGPCVWAYQAVSWGSAPRWKARGGGGTLTQGRCGVLDQVVRRNCTAGRRRGSVRPVGSSPASAQPHLLLPSVSCPTTSNLDFCHLD